jgi:pimeloyl-ACP methyl ester carboxylesterase
MEHVILVPGLWHPGHDMLLLRVRIAAAGYATTQFRYRSVREPPAEAARQLVERLRAMRADIIHFVCHSLGGIVIRHLFHEFPDQPPGRIVTLATPHQGSSAASWLAARELGRRMLGNSIHAGLLGDAPPWPDTHELGVIAGRLRFGFGMLIPGIPQPSDGTVAVGETMLPGMRDHIVLPVSHFGMLIAPSVARQTLHFLRHGRFQR